MSRRGLKIPRIVIAGAGSSVGKTTVAIGLMGLLKDRGYRIQPFKAGPDYIDPSYHTSVAGARSRNLDSWLLTSRGILEVFQRSAQDSDIAVIEGVMGLFDGLDESDEAGSTAHIAKILKCPVILVIDAHGMARSAAAAVLGYRELDRGLRLAGVILNRVGGEAHAELCKRAIETYTGIPVIGALPRSTEIALPERHLGLVPTPEGRIGPELIRGLVKLVEVNIDLERTVEIARSAPELPKVDPAIFPEPARPMKAAVGIAYDEAFNFYYWDALDLLRSYGMELRFFSPIHDREVPEDIDGICIGGGFPEVYAKQLEDNHSMRNSLRKAVEDGMPIYAECGGTMYLTNSIVDLDGKSYSMVGVLDANTVMTKRLTLNYTLARVVKDNPLTRAGYEVRGHEFHFSKIVSIPKDAQFAYIMERGTGMDGLRDAWIEHGTIASYMHTHLASNPNMAANFLKACERHRRR